MYSSSFPRVLVMFEFQTGHIVFSVFFQPISKSTIFSLIILLDLCLALSLHVWCLCFYVSPRTPLSDYFRVLFLDLLVCVTGSHCCRNSSWVRHPSGLRWNSPDHDCKSRLLRVLGGILFFWKVWDSPCPLPGMSDVAMVIWVVLPSYGSWIILSWTCVMWIIRW